MRKNDETMNRKPWPADCIWPRPLYFGEGPFRDAEDAELTALDETAEDLLQVKEYYDYLVECGRLNNDYSWNDDYDGGDFMLNGDESPEDPEAFMPELDEEYWEGGFFDIEQWEEDLTEHMNMLKLDIDPHGAAAIIEQIIGYDFANENLLRQAFTRRAFAIEHGLSGDSEQLEFLGDSVLNAIVTKEIIDSLAEVDVYKTDAPFTTSFGEGDFTKIRSSFVSKEFLAAKAAELGLDQYILYGSGEEPTESSREDMMEALIGAVTIDSGWDMDAVVRLIDRLLCIQMNEPHKYLRKSYYEIFNAWHMKRFGEMPDYTIDGRGPYTCLIRFSIPENDKGLWRRQIQDARGETRSRARDMAAELAYHFVVTNGLWIDIRESGIIPNKEDSINQLQELYQKKYLEKPAEYSFEESMMGTWFCDCVCCDILGGGSGPSKTAAKKEAAYKVLDKLFRSSRGIL